MTITSHEDTLSERAFACSSTESAVFCVYVMWRVREFPYSGHLPMKGVPGFWNQGTPEVEMDLGLKRDHNLH